MSTADLTALIGKLGAQLKAVGQVPKLSPEMALAAANPRSGGLLPVGFQPTAPTATIPGPKGIFGHVKADAEHLLPELSDILSRGQYASANVAHGVENDTAKAIKSPQNPLDLIKAAADFALPGVGAVAEHPHEAVSGLAGTKKGNYADVIQHGADLIKENGNVKAAEANPGIAKVNPWVKGIGGLIGDVALDPTTYLGTGLAGKVLDAPKIAENLDKTAQAASDAKRLESTIGVHDGNMPSTVDSIANQLGASVKDKIGKSAKRATFLSDKEVHDAINAAAPLRLKLARRSSIETWTAAQQEAEKEFPRLAANSTRADRADRERQIFTKTKELTGNLTQRQLRDKKFGELTELMHANLKPETARSLGITFAGKSIVHIPYESLAQKAYNLKAGSGALTKSMTTFKNAFSTNLPDDLKAITTSARGLESQKTRQLNHDLVGLYGKSKPEDLKRVVNAVRSGHAATIIPSMGDQSTDLVQHFGDGIRSIQDAIRHTPDSPGVFRSMSEMNHYLDPKFRLPGGSTDKLEPNWLIDTLQKQAGEHDKDLNNPAHLLFNYQHAMQMASTNRATRETIAHDLGHSLLNEDGTQNLSIPALRKLGYRRALTKGGNAIPYMENHIFDPETAKAVERYHDMLSQPGTTNDILRTYDGAMRVWKSAITKYNPGYHERNLMGDTFANYYAGVHDVRDYRDAGKILHGRTTRFYGPGGDDIAGKAAITLRKPIVLDGRKVKSLTSDQVWNLYVENGLKTGWLTTEFGKGIDRATSSGVTKVLHLVNSNVQKGTEDVEDFSRLTHFIHLLKSGVQPSEAGKEVRKFHFDYSDFTPFERKIMTRAFPFYKWTRKNIPLQLERTFATPGKVLAVPKAERAISTILGYNTGNNVLPQGDAIAPDWLRKDMAFPVGGWGTNGDTVYDDPPLPWQQAYETLEQPKDTAGQMSNPIFQLAVEALTGKTTQGYDSGGVGKTLENETPYSRLIAGLAHSGSTGKSKKVSLAQFLSGLGLYENTPKQQQETQFFANGGR